MADLGAETGDVQVHHERRRWHALTLQLRGGSGAARRPRHGDGPVSLALRRLGGAGFPSDHLRGHSGQRRPERLAHMLSAEIVAVIQNQGPASPPAGPAPQVTNASSAQLARNGGPATTDIVSQALARPLHGGGLAVAPLNHDESPTKLAVSWGQLGLPPAQKMAMRGVANNQDRPPVVGRLEAAVGKHDATFVRLTLLKEWLGIGYSNGSVLTARCVNDINISRPQSSCGKLASALARAALHAPRGGESTELTAAPSTVP